MNNLKRLRTIYILSFLAFLVLIGLIILWSILTKDGILGVYAQPWPLLLLLYLVPLVLGIISLALIGRIRDDPSLSKKLYIVPRVFSIITIVVSAFYMIGIGALFGIIEFLRVVVGSFGEKSYPIDSSELASILIYFYSI